MLTATRPHQAVTVDRSEAEAVRDEARRAGIETSARVSLNRVNVTYYTATHAEAVRLYRLVARRGIRPR